MIFVYKKIQINDMKLFKRGLITVKCSFPRFHDEDQTFIMRGFKVDLVKEFGSCYDIEIYLNRGFGVERDSVTIEKYRNKVVSPGKEEAKLRAIRLKILSVIRKLK